MAKNETIKLAKGTKIHVLVSRQSDYAKAKLEFSVDEVLAKDDDLTERMEAICEELEEVADSRIAVYEDGYVEPEETEPEPEPEPEQEEPDADPEGADPDGVDPEEEEQEEIELDEDGINAMDKAELVELCETTEGLEDIDIKKGVKVLRVLIIDALFEEEEPDDTEGDTEGTDPETDPETEDDDEWQDDDWKD